MSDSFWTGSTFEDNVVRPYSHRKEWWEWERAKGEMKNMDLSFLNENEVFNCISVDCRDENAIGIT